MGIIERDDLRAPLLPLADAPRERLVELLRTLGLVDGGGRVAEGATGARRRGVAPGRARWWPHDRPRRSGGGPRLDDPRRPRRGPAPRGRARRGRTGRLACRPRGQGGDPRPVPRPRDGHLGSRRRAGVPRPRRAAGQAPARRPDASAALEAGRPWRIVPGGTTVRAGVYLGPGVVVMPPSFVNVGAWIGEDTMVDSHVLVGSCAQVGARVHLVGRRHDRRRPRAGRGAAGHRRGRRVRGAGIVPAGGRAGRGRGGHRGRRDPDRDLAPVRPRPGPGDHRAPPRRRSRCPPGAVVVPGSRALGGSFATENGLSVAVALLVKDRDAGTDARVTLEEALR